MHCIKIISKLTQISKKIGIGNLVTDLIVHYSTIIKLLCLCWVYLTACHYDVFLFSFVLYFCYVVFVVYVLSNVFLRSITMLSRVSCYLSLCYGCIFMFFCGLLFGTGIVVRCVAFFLCFSFRIWLRWVGGLWVCLMLLSEKCVLLLFMVLFCDGACLRCRKKRVSPDTLFRLTLKILLTCN